MTMADDCRSRRCRRSLACDRAAEPFRATPLTRHSDGASAYDLGPHPVRAGKGDEIYVRVLDEPTTDRRPGPRDEIEDTGRKPRVVDDLDQLGRHNGCLAGRLHDHRAARRERRTSHTAQNRQRERERSDHRADALG